MVTAALPQVTVFTDGPQAVILQGLNVAAFSTNDRTEDTERAPKMGPAEAERSQEFKSVWRAEGRGAGLRGSLMWKIVCTCWESFGVAVDGVRG
eukprot:1683983-Rhodomonas_salina.2